MGFAALARIVVGGTVKLVCDVLARTVCRHRNGRLAYTSADDLYT